MQPAPASDATLPASPAPASVLVPASRVDPASGVVPASGIVPASVGSPPSTPPPSGVELEASPSVTTPSLHPRAESEQSKARRVLAMPNILAPGAGRQQTRAGRAVT